MNVEHKDKTLDDVFSALGGVPEIALFLGINRTAPHHWRHVPKKHVVPLYERAIEKGVKWITLPLLLDVKRDVA